MLRVRKDEPVTAAHDLRHIVSPAEQSHRIFHAEFPRSCQYVRLLRPGSGEDSDRPRLDAPQMGEHIHYKDGVLLLNQSSPEKKNQRILREMPLTTKPGAIGGGVLEQCGIQSVVVHEIAFGSACASREKRVKRMVGDSDDAIGHIETDSPHRFAIEVLLEAAWGEHCFIRIMHMNDPPDGHPRRG